MNAVLSQQRSPFPTTMPPSATAPLLPLVVTAGSRESIGAEILAKAWRFWARRSQHKHRGRGALCFLSLGGHKADFEAFSVPCCLAASPSEACEIFPHALPLLEEGQGACDSLDAALQLCREGKASGIVTLPVEKKVFAQRRKKPHGGTKQGGTREDSVLWGHTEYIAASLGVEEFGMLLAWRNVRTLPVTRHMALRHAVARIDETAVVKAARLVHKALQEDFGIVQPRLAVAGLNPHAGEGGACGDEEVTILRPALARLLEEGIVATGPHSPDSLFLSATRKTFDCALTLYHDQGLIPLKLLSYQRAVNITLGLPIVRCSPDHGTARDLVGQGVADAGSLIAALAMAWRMARARARARARRAPEKGRGKAC